MDYEQIAFLVSDLIRTDDADLDWFKQKNFDIKTEVDLDQLRLIRDLTRAVGAYVQHPDEKDTWRRIAEAASVLDIAAAIAVLDRLKAGPTEDEAGDNSPQLAAETAGDVEGAAEASQVSPASGSDEVGQPSVVETENQPPNLSPEMAAVGAVSVPNVMDLHGAPGLVSAPAPVSNAAAAVPPPRVTTPSVSSAPGASPWSGGGAATPQPVAPPVSPVSPAASPAVVPESATAPPLSRPAGPPAVSLSAMPGQLSTAPSPAGAAAFGARESGVPVDQTATGVKPTPEQRLRVSQPLPFSSNPGGAAKAPSAEPMPAQRTAPVDLGQTTAGVFDSVQALPFATANSAASAGDEAIADDPSDQDLGAGLPFGRAKAQRSGHEPPAQPQVPAQPPPPPRRPDASAPAAVELETERMAAFTIEQYAEVWVMMAAYPNHVVELRTRYGLADEAAHGALNAHFQQRFASDPAQRASFTAACDQVKQRLNP